MGIYIKDMEKPKNCFDCPCYNDEYCRCQTKGNWMKGDVYGKPPEWCPIVDVLIANANSKKEERGNPQ